MTFFHVFPHRRSGSEFIHFIPWSVIVVDGRIINVGPHPSVVELRGPLHSQHVRVSAVSPSLVPLRVVFDAMRCDGIVMNEGRSCPRVLTP